MNDYISPVIDEPELVRKIRASHPAFSKDSDSAPDLSRFTVYRELINGSILPHTVIEKWRITDKNQTGGLVIDRAVKGPASLNFHMRSKLSGVPSARSNLLGVRRPLDRWRYEAKTLMAASELGIPGIPRAYSFVETHDALIMDYLPDEAVRLHCLLNESATLERRALDETPDGAQRARLAQQYAAERCDWAMASLERLVFLQNGLNLAVRYEKSLANPNVRPEAIRPYMSWLTTTTFAAAVCARLAVADDTLRPKLQAQAAARVPGSLSRFFYGHLGEPYRRLKRLFAHLECGFADPGRTHLAPTVIHGDYYPTNILLDPHKPRSAFVVDLDKVACRGPGVLDFVKNQGGVYETIEDKERLGRFFSYLDSDWRLKKALTKDRRAIGRAIARSPDREAAIGAWAEAQREYDNTAPPSFPDGARSRQAKALDCALLYETAFLMGVRLMFPLRFPEHAKNIWASPALALWRFYTQENPIEADLQRLEHLLTAMSANQRPGYGLSGGERAHVRALKDYLGEIGFFEPVPAHCYGPQPD